jgi:hypothetical protein
MKIWHGRSATPLVVVWAFALAIAASVYEIDRIQPALADLFHPAYFIVVGVALLVTWKWFTERTSGKMHDRRHADRRHTDRRDDNEEL